MDYLLTNVSMNETKCTTKYRELIGKIGRAHV